MVKTTVRVEDIINDRPGHVLKEIIEVYTETGQPVGSKTIAERLPVTLSSATIRNVMADLEEMGLLASPHTSAGRIPTEQGLRLYVRGMVTVEDLNRAVQQRMQQDLAQAVNFQQVVNSASRMLAQVSGCAGLVLAPRHNEERLHQVEFVRLSGDRVLVVLVSQTGNVENRIIHVPPHITANDLREAAHQLNQVAQGLTLHEAQQTIFQTLKQHKLALDQMMDHMFDLGMANETTLVVGGSQNLFSYPELVRERLHGLFEAFEEKRLLIGLLDQVKKGDGVQIFIGAECPLEVARDCTMITSTYASQDQRVVGTVGVIGPMRMNYKQNIALVDYTARLLSRALDEAIQG